MTSRVPQFSFEHRHPLGRPSCPRCGQLCLFPEQIAYVNGRVSNSWKCENCSACFETSATFNINTGQPRAAA
jgi:hypothetical protein